jgi:thiamine biosynthesis lipoprotein
MKTKRFHTWTAFLALLITAMHAPACAQTPTRAVVFRTQTMGTWGSLTLVTSDSAAVADLAYETLKAFHRVDSLMSNWTDISEVARINREAGKKEITIHPEVATVLTHAQEVAGQSDGAFDVTVEPLVRLWGFLGGTPRVPKQEEITAVLERVGYGRLLFDADAQTLRFNREDLRIDLGGIAKGYGVDQAADILRRAEVTDALIDLSGNMVALGNAAAHDGWWVGIRDPSGEYPYLARLNLHNEAVATSGDYEQFVDADGKRHGHILDPRTGWSAQGLSSVTVVTYEATVADAWATALFVLGPEAARQIARERDDLAVILIEPRPNDKDIIWIEEPLRSRFEIRGELKAALTVRSF